jgi:hypothetical protein
LTAAAGVSYERSVALDPAFVADCPYGPEALLLDEILLVDREASLIRARMPTHEALPLTRDQRAHPQRHPRHVSGGLMIHATGMLGFAHGYHILDLRHAEGWIAYGTHIHAARFRKMGRIGPPVVLDCQATRIRRIGGNIIARYRFEFAQEGETIYEGEQTAVWTPIPPAS